MTNHPSPAGPDGRDTAGRFKPGNQFGQGNPHARRVQELRTAMLDAISPEYLRDVVRVLVEEAKQGSVQAAKEVLDRSLGKADAIDLLQRIETLEEAIRT